MQPQFDHTDVARETSNRETCRGDVAIVADIRAFGGNKTRVKVIDLSQTGFRMESLTLIADSQAIFLTIPSFGQMEARIIWQTEWLYGCKFVRPLYLAVYEHIVRTHPALAAEATPVTAGMMYGAAASIQWGRALG